ncbi:hypothetical protein EVAR_66016_1 [Eumeta japonica]|uniref:Uncharacterized protein n=1 Tax=Eumeta variegata TaxID=151549 RepID=A0A4C1Z6G7_EUMVA|nr:hypothetical protein EVAR_66016_1 [Eumeta japonica]
MAKSHRAKLKRSDHGRGFVLIIFYELRRSLCSGRAAARLDLVSGSTLSRSRAGAGLEGAVKPEAHDHKIKSVYSARDNRPGTKFADKFLFPRGERDYALRVGANTATTAPAAPAAPAEARSSERRGHPERNRVCVKCSRHRARPLLLPCIVAKPAPAAPADTRGGRAAGAGQLVRIRQSKDRPLNTLRTEYSW